MKRYLLMLALLLIPVPGFAQVVVSVPGIRVMGPPPPPRVEVQVARPSPNHIWIAGHYAWEGGTHVWIGGHWAIPPQPGYVWEPARWVNNGGQYMYYRGHWRHGAPPQPTVVYEPPAETGPPVDVEVAPPEPIVEVRPALPFANAVWLPGYWHWYGGRHVWVGGRWSAPRPGYSWEAAHWQGYGRYHRFVPGHWRR